MTAAPQPADPSHSQGARAEEIVNWYFRLNGFLQISGFVLHSDEPRRLISDADILGVRFPFSRESIRRIRMTDDRWLSEVCRPAQVLFVLGEVKVTVCGVNGPWTDRERGGMEKVIERIGFAPEEMTSEIASSMYNQLCWQNDNYRIQYVSVGERKNHELSKRYPQLKQLTWDDIAHFLFERFQSFGPFKGSHPQWGRFGSAFAKAHVQDRINNATSTSEFLKSYIREGFSEGQELKAPKK